MKYNIVSINQNGTKFVNIDDLPLPDSPVSIVISKEYIEYNRPYGSVTSTNSIWYITVNRYTFTIRGFRNHFTVEAGVTFFAYCKTWHNALQLGVKCTIAHQKGYVINWIEYPPLAT